MSSYQYRKSHCGDKTILRPSYLHNGISHTGKTTSLYWIGAQMIKCLCITYSHKLITFFYGFPSCHIHLFKLCVCDIKCKARKLFEIPSTIVLRIFRNAGVLTLVWYDCTCAAVDSAIGHSKFLWFKQLPHKEEIMPKGCVFGWFIFYIQYSPILSQSAHNWYIIIPPAQQSWRGVYRFHLVCYYFVLQQLISYRIEFLSQESFPLNFY